MLNYQRVCHTDLVVISIGTTPLKNDGLRQLGLLFPIYGKNVPSHQPDDDHLINKPWGLGASMGILQSGPYWWQWQPDEMCLDSTWTGTWKLLQHMYSTWMTVLYCAHRKSTVQKLWCIYLYVFWFTRSTRNDVSPGNAMFFFWCSATLQKGRFFSAAPIGAYRPVQILWNMLFQKESSPTTKSMFLKEHSIYIYIHTIFYTFISLYIPFFLLQKNSHVCGFIHSF